MGYVPSKGNKESRLIYLSKKTDELEKKIEKNKEVNLQKYRALQDFVRLLTNFASHDIKNAVHNMDGLISTLDIDNVTEKDVKVLKKCLDNIRKSLDEFKILSVEKEKDSFKLIELISSLQSLHRPLFKKENVTFGINYINVKKDLLINHSFHPILQIFNNLLINSFEFLDGSERREIKIDIELNDENIVIVKIADTGVGIPDSNKSKIFTPYFSTKEKGSGVGLAHVRFVLDELKGTIKLLPSDNYYSTIFEVKLPIR